MNALNLVLKPVVKSAIAPLYELHIFYLSVSRLFFINFRQHSKIKIYLCILIKINRVTHDQIAYFNLAWHGMAFILIVRNSSDSIGFANSSCIVFFKIIVLFSVSHCHW